MFAEGSPAFIGVEYRRPFVWSAAGHLLCAFLVFFNFGGGRSTTDPAIIYSVTVEAGQNLGGVSQVAKDDKKTPLAPHKKVAKEEKEDPKVKAAEKTKAEKEKKEKEKAEISLKEKQKEEKLKKEKELEKKKQAAKKEADAAAELNKQLEKAMQRYKGESTDAGGKGFGAGALGGKGMGGGVLLPPEALAYRDALKEAIKEGWRWYDTNSALVTTVVFDIAENGVISQVSVSTSSGNREFDDSVLRAIYKASPVPAPPEKVYQYFKRVRMVFDPRE